MKVYPFWKDPVRLAEKLTIAVDFEWYDQTNGKHLTEIGLTIQPHPASENNTVSRHIKIAEHVHFKNRYCPTSQLGFIFGKTEHLALQDAKAELIYWLSSAKNKCPVDLVWHNGILDRKIFNNLGIDVDSYVDNIYDTGTMHKIYRHSHNLRKLEFVAADLGVDIDKRAFHNAGNDSYYTLCCYNMLSGHSVAVPKSLITGEQKQTSDKEEGELSSDDEPL